MDAPMDAPMDAQAQFAWCARQDWPAAADPAAASRLIERIGAASAEALALTRTPGGDALLRAVGGNSPYLADLAVREAATLCRIAAAGPQGVVDDALAGLAGIAPVASQPQVAAGLRRAKRVVALAVALADIGGAWRLDRVTGALSALADAALQCALAQAVHAAQEAGALRATDPTRPMDGSMEGCGVVALAMGKLGGGELNYSSDVDLVLLHDPQAGAGDPSRAIFTRIARTVVALMEARDGDGYVFRTDLRLRPDPGTTPPSVAVLAATTYYESMGQTWERAAMLRARPAAGDLALGWEFLDAIRPFVWRRGLDFAAIADLHAMKRRIDAHKGARLSAEPDPLRRIAGHDLKLGEGGIREIEFVVQSLQLVWGGRDPGLRTRRTVEGLRLLARAGHLPARVAGELAAAYRFLRRVEHRLQMVADRQTHSLPSQPAALAAFALFMGFADPEAFARALLRHLERVKRRYGDVFAQVPGDPGAAVQFELTEARLASLGFAEPAAVVATIEGWRSGRVRALRSDRARFLLGLVLPGLVDALARQAQPDAAFARLDRLLAALPAGVQLLSLFQRNPQLLARVADVLGAAPALADHLASTPAALDGLLVPAGLGDDPALGLERRLQDARGLEDAIAIIRRSVREQEFAISVATLEGRLDADAAGGLRADLAGAAIAALLPPVLADMARRHGTVPGGELAVVLLGKAGGREMMAGSDLDLMLVYDHPPEVSASETRPGETGRGARSLPASQWFIRAVHAFMAALTAPDASGALYAADMRLRPSGNKGPVAVSLAAFERYHQPGGGAWTWERMALTRARIVAGPRTLQHRLAAAIRHALRSAGDPSVVRADAAAMRARLWRDARPSGPPYAWRSVKLRPGGLVEVEFVAQALQLVHARLDPPPLSPTTRHALRLLEDVGALAAPDAALLVRADRAWRTVLGMARLTQDRQESGLSGAALEAMLHAARQAGLEAVDLDGLHASLESLADQLRLTFVRLIGPVLVGPVQEGDRA